jgi:predicted metal-dependent hydrolase
MEVELVRKAVKNVSLRVSASTAQVRITVPWAVDDKAAQRFVLAKWDWIKRQQAKFKQQARAKQQPVAKIVSGERHPFLGRLYPLQVLEYDGRPRVVHDEQSLSLYVRPHTSFDKREALLDAWYRQQLKERVPALMAKWEPIIGVKVSEWGIRKMRTRWGSCNINAARVWLSLELAKKPPQCLEYVLVHEMVHLLERYHNAHFYGLMDRFLPSWRDHRETLNAPNINPV